jgi:putative endonuclease
VWPFGRRPAKQSARDGAADLGRRGESLARRELRKQGLKILARNYRCPLGEADLIALDPSTRKQSGAETIAFVEVKTRAGEGYAPPESAVNADKQRRMRKVAHYYLASRNADAFHTRFDIVAVVLRPGEKPEIRYIRNAF